MAVLPIETRSSRGKLYGPNDRALKLIALLSKGMLYPSSAFSIRRCDRFPNSMRSDCDTSRTHFKCHMDWKPSLQAISMVCVKP